MDRNDFTYVGSLESTPTKNRELDVAGGQAGHGGLLVGRGGLLVSHGEQFA